MCIGVPVPKWVRAVRCPGTGFTDGCEPPDTSGLLQECSVLLTTEPTYPTPAPTPPDSTTHPTDQETFCAVALIHMSLEVGKGGSLCSDLFPLVFQNRVCERRGIWIITDLLMWCVDRIVWCSV